MEAVEVGEMAEEVVEHFQIWRSWVRDEVGLKIQIMSTNDDYDPAPKKCDSKFKSWAGIGV